MGEGFYREGAQFILEKGVDIGAQALVHGRTAAAIVSGTVAATAAGVAGASFAAGNVAGTLVRNYPPIGQFFGY
jgi:hypothetical protein